jgi:hypothetical protein
MVTNAAVWKQNERKEEKKLGFKSQSISTDESHFT